MTAPPFTNPPDAVVRDLLGRARRLAVVGASPDPARPSHRVMAYLLDAGYEAVPVRPGGGAVLGVAVAGALAQVAPPIDLVVVFRRSEHVPGVVDEALAAGARALWLQEGVVHAEAAERARAAGLTVVMDRCALKEHARLLG